MLSIISFPIFQLAALVGVMAVGVEGGSATTFSTSHSGDSGVRAFEVSLGLGSSTPTAIPEPDLATLVSLSLALLVFHSRFRLSHRAAPK
jgi:hypothetical protein